MPSCSVVDCKNTSCNVNYGKDGISFHTYPEDPTIKEKWINATGKGPNWFPTKNSSICSSHFAEECLRPLAKVRRLFEWAVPTLKLRKIWSNDTKETSTSNNDCSEPDDDEKPAADTTMECLPSKECVNTEAEVDPALSITTYSLTSKGISQHVEKFPKIRPQKKESIQIRKLQNLIKKQRMQIKSLQKSNSRYLKNIEKLKKNVQNLKDERKPRWC